MHDPESLVASPFDDTVLVMSGFDNAFYVLDGTDSGNPPFKQRVGPLPRAVRLRSCPGRR